MNHLTMISTRKPAPAAKFCRCRGRKTEHKTICFWLPVYLLAFSVAALTASGGSPTPYVTGAELGTLRHDFSGYVGMEIVVGTNPISVVSLGRCFAAGNTGPHALELVNAENGVETAVATTAITMTNGSVGQFQYTKLSTPAALAAGGTYYVVSQETEGGDKWYDMNTFLTTTIAAAQDAAVWSYGSGQWNLEGLPGQAYVPVNFQYTSMTFNPNLAASASPAATRYLTGAELGTIRNDFSGYVGMEIVVGTNPISVVSLGRCFAAGNTGTHSLELVSAENGIEETVGSTVITMTNGTVGQFQYAALSSPVALAAGATYYVVSQETAGGDKWYDMNTLIATTTAAAQDAAVWSYGSGQWNLEGTPGQAYVPVDFQYTSVAFNPNVPAARFVTGTVLGSLRNDFSGYVGMQINVGNNPINVTSLGRIIAPGNLGTHTLALVNAANGIDVPGGTAAITMTNGTVGQFQYTALSSPVALAAGSIYYVVSQETEGGDLWYDMNTLVTTTTAADQNAAVWSYGLGQWNVEGVPGQVYVPVDFQFSNAATNVPGATRFVTGTVLGSLRNDFSGYVGMQIVVGAKPISIVALGRCFAAGDSGSHTLELVNAANGTVVAGGSTTLATGGGTAGQFQYASLNTPVALAPGGTYYVLSQETEGGDPWYDMNTLITTTAAADQNAAVWSYGSGQWNLEGVPGQAYVPVDFQYTNSVLQSQDPTGNITNGLVAWYPLAGNANDYSTNGNNGIFVGSPAPATGVNGITNTATYFSSSYMTIPHVVVQTNSSFSVSLWFNASQLDNTYLALLDAGAFNIGNAGWCFGFDDLNRLYIACGTGYIASSFVFSPGVFYHVVATAQAGSPYAFTIYVNGVATSVAASGPVSTWSQDTEITDVGRSVNSPPLYFTGAMQDVRVYDRVLSPAEAITLYTNGTSRSVETPGQVKQPDLLYLKFLDDIDAIPQYSYINWPAPLKDSSLVDNPHVVYFSNAGTQDNVWVEVNGVPAAGLHWDGVGGSYADTGDSNHFDFTTNSYTIGLWVQPLTAGGTFLSCGVAGSNGWCVSEDYNYNLFFNTYSNGQTSSFGSVPVHNNAFHAILISVSHGTNVTIYQDGAAYSTGTVNLPAPSGTNTLMLGQQNLGSSFGKTLDGNMWMTQIWSTNLNAVEAAYLYMYQLNGSPWP